MKIIIFAFFLSLFLSLPAQAADCPFGVENDPAPGQCRLYTDGNGDHYCDYGEAEKEAVAAKTVASQPKAEKKDAERSSGTDFYLLPLTIVFFVLQAVLIALLKVKKISLLTLKKINNWLLLLFFIVIIVSSVPFLLRAAGLANPSGLLTWSLIHTDSGWLMILFSVEHVVRRWWYFKVGGKKSA